MSGSETSKSVPENTILGMRYDAFYALSIESIGALLMSFCDAIHFYAIGNESWEEDETLEFETCTREQLLKWTNESIAGSTAKTKRKVMLVKAVQYVHQEVLNRAITSHQLQSTVESLKREMEEEEKEKCDFFTKVEKMKIKGNNVSINNNNDMRSEAIPKLEDVKSDNNNKVQFNTGNFKPVKLDTHMREIHGSVNDDVEAWFLVVDNFVKRHNLARNKIIETVFPLIRGYAFSVLIKLQKQQPPLRPEQVWDQFKEILSRQYRAEDIQDKLLRELIAMRHGSEDFNVYANKFLSIANRIIDVREKDLIYYFREGLHKQAKYILKKENPPTLIDCIREVAKFEETYVEAHKYEINRVNYSSTQFPKKPHGYNKVSSSNNNNSNSNNNNARFSNYKKDYSRANTNKFVPKNEHKPLNHDQQTGYKNNNNNTGNNNNNKKIVCYKCNMPGHTANKCFSKKTVAKVNTIEPVGRIEKVLTCEMESTRMMHVSGLVNDVKLKLCFDSGATRSVISSRVVDKHGFKVIPSNLKVKVANNEVTNVVGVTEPVLININGHVCQLSMMIMHHDDHDVLLGLDWFLATGAGLFPAENVLKFPSEKIYIHSENEEYDEEDVAVVETVENEELEFPSPLDNMCNKKQPSEEEIRATFKPVLPLNTEQQIKFENVVNRFITIVAVDLNTLGVCTVTKHKICIQQNVPPINKPSYRRSREELKRLHAKVQELIKSGVCGYSTSPWSSPAFLIGKPDGDDRFLVDFRPLNSVTITENWPLPRIEDILDRLSGSLVASTLDLTASYYQIELEDESKEYTAFTVNGANYQFNKLAMGLKNAPSAFMRMMHQVLGDLSFVEIYIDDITVHSKSIDDHLDHLLVVAERLEKANLKIKPSKCTWIADEIKILGHIVSGGTVKMDPEKIKAIKNRAPPKNVKQLQQFLGLANYYRRFIEKFAHKAKPLFELLKKENKFDWTKICVTAYNLLTEALVSYPVLRQPNFQLRFFIHTDASGFALGVILSQKEGEYEYAVCFFSRLLKGAELHYTITEKECLAVVYGIKQCRTYIWGTRFTVVTDHSALAWLMNISDPSSRLVRWSLLIQSYEFDIEHRKGKLHTNVDALSRPVIELANQLAINNNDNNNEVSSKSLDLFEDEALLHYLRQGRHLNGLPRKQVNRVCKAAAFIEIINNSNKEQFFFKKCSKDKKQTKFLEYPPIENRQEIIKNNHNLGHFQAETTINRILERYYWKRLKGDVENFIKKCDPCKREHKVTHYNHPAIANRVYGIFEKVGMDLTFGFPESDGYVGFLCIVEYLSGYIYTIPIKSKYAKEICEKVWTYFCIFGIPRSVIHDQGNEFKSHLLSFLLQKINVHQWTTASFSPRVNGKTEKYNYLIAEALRKCLDGEFDKTKWVEYLSFVTLAFNSKIHTRTGFTPYEIIFGRKMNTFNDWRVNVESNEIEELANRTREIKNLVESSHVTASDNIRRNQETQKRQQNNNQNVQINKLDINTIVYVKTMGIQNKLAPRYRGPFKIIEITKNGDYILENSMHERMADTYPLSRLKVIEDKDEMSQKEIYRVQKIIKHRKVGEEFEYLVKWKDFPNSANSWEPKSSFQELDLINKYWSKNKEESTPTRIQPTRVKNNNVYMLQCLIIALILIPICVAKPIIGDLSQNWIAMKGEFFYCEKPSVFTSAILDVNHNCRVKANEYKNLIIDNNDREKIHVVSKMSMAVKGRAWMCKKEKIIITQYVNFFGALIINTNIEEINLHRFECEFMLESKKCMEYNLTQVDNKWEYDGTPKFTVGWLQQVTRWGYKCSTQTRVIIAKTVDDKVFNSDCTAKSLECRVGNAIIIWRPDVYHNCPFNFVTTLNNSSINNNIVFSEKEKLAFQIINKTKIEECNLEVYGTREGLFLSTENKAAKLAQIDGDITEINEMMLAEADGQSYKSYKETINLQNEICEEFRQSLQITANQQNGFVRVHDFNGKEHIFYVESNIILIPKCTVLKELQFSKQRIMCELPLVSVNWTYGYINKKLIITKEKNEECANNNFFLFPEMNSLIYHNNSNKYFQYTIDKLEKLDTLKLNQINEINFPHNNKVISSVEVLKEIIESETFDFPKAKHQENNVNNDEDKSEGNGESDLAGLDVWSSLKSGKNYVIGSMKTLGYFLISIIVLIFFSSIISIAFYGYKRYSQTMFVKGLRELTNNISKTNNQAKENIPLQHVQEV